ncbi:hypothetical protein MRX96_009305 [Rhipicephalus microplus]
MAIDHPRARGQRPRRSQGPISPRNPGRPPVEEKGQDGAHDVRLAPVTSNPVRAQKYCENRGAGSDRGERTRWIQLPVRLRNVHDLDTRSVTEYWRNLKAGKSSNYSGDRFRDGQFHRNRDNMRVPRGGENFTGLVAQIGRSSTEAGI